MPRYCAAPHCEVHVTSAMLMCKRHWFQVPRPIRNEVWAEWRAWLKAPTREGLEKLKAAQSRAVEALVDA